MKYIKLYEKFEDSLVKLLSVNDFNNLFDVRTVLKPTDKDIKEYEKFANSLYKDKIINKTEHVTYTTIDINTGFLTIDRLYFHKFDDEYYGLTITKNMKGNKEGTMYFSVSDSKSQDYIIDTIDGFKEVDKFQDFINESFFDFFKSSYRKSKNNKDGSAKYYHYKKMELKLQGKVNITRSKLNPILDTIYEVSKKWYLVNNSIDIYQSNMDKDDRLYKIYYRFSDSENLDPELPRDIAEEIVTDMYNKLYKIGFIESTTKLNVSKFDTRNFLGHNIGESFTVKISKSSPYVEFTIKIMKD